MADVTLEEEIRALEERLLAPEVRASRNELTRLLADDFVEFGSSGRTFDKEEIITLLEQESPPECSVHEFRLKRLSRDVALATYRAVARAEPPEKSRSSLRSSIWVYRQERWQLTFHQGTRERAK